MLGFKPLDINDKELFDKYLKPYTFKTCEYSFTNLFIWRKGCDIQYTLLDDILIIRKMNFDGTLHFMQPVGYTKGNLKTVIDKLLTLKREQHLDYLFRDAEESFISDLSDIYPDKFIIEEDRDNFDYIYSSKSLIELSGKKLHSKKNHYNHFIKHNKYRTAPISQGNIHECIASAREWCNRNDCKGYLLYELRAISELLNNMNKLYFDGMAIYVKDKISAFTIGERLNDEMAVIHIEKADSDINGLYAYINRSFIENYYSDIPYINREQDLGIEGLRQAKETYQPIKLEKKYMVREK